MIRSRCQFVAAIYDLKWDDVAFIQFVTDNLHRFDDGTQRLLKKKFGTDKRVFTHNNCLPCKNMEMSDLLAVEYFYPGYLQKAIALSEELKKYWGRSADEFYTSFGRPDLGYGKQPCEICAAD